MIIDSKGSNIETIGDITEFKTKIDPKNIEFITTLLSSNLYSHPERSFIREIVSNAWDSHVEAKNTNNPVIVKFTKTREFSNYGNITIRDYGTGLSKEKFEELYCAIGSSTKRETNDYIGGFGIGKFSSMACSNVVYINSHYNGTCYCYIMTKNGNNITTNLVTTIPTQEKNGLEITIKNVLLDKYRESLDYIIFFPNVYVEGLPYLDFNTIKIKHYTNFAVSEKRAEHKLLLGNVLYPINESVLSAETRRFVNKQKYNGIVFKFNVGDLQVTPNRENIIYTTETIKVIEDKIVKAREEILNLVKKDLPTDITNPIEAYNLFYNGIYYDLLNNKCVKNNNNYELFETSLSESQLPLTINNVQYKDSDIKFIGYLLNTEIYNLVAVSNNERVYKELGKLPYFIRRASKYSSDNKIIVVNDNLRFTTALKSYIVENYPYHCFIHKYSFEEFKSFCNKHVLCCDVVDNTKEELLKLIYKNNKDTWEYVDFDNDKDFLQYKNDLKTQSKTNKVTSTNIILSITERNDVYRSTYTIKKTFTTYKDVVQHIKNLKKGVIIKELSDNLYNNLACDLGYVIIQAAKPIIKALKEENFTCAIDENSFITNQKIIDLKTILSMEDKPFRAKNTTFINLLNDSDKEVIKYFYSLKDTFGYNSNACVFHNDNIEINESLKKKLSALFDLQEYYISMIQDFSIPTGYQIGEDLAALIMYKNKAYRINYKTYHKIKSNKIFNIICKK